MKKKRFSIEQIVAVVKEAELGTPVTELIRKVGISEQTFYRWKKVYGGLEPSQARRLKQLEEENAKLKRLVADLSLDKIMLQDVLKKSDPALAANGFAAVRARGLLRLRAPVCGPKPDPSRHGSGGNVRRVYPPSTAANGQLPPP